VDRPGGVPVVVAGEGDVFPSERRNVGEQFVGDTGSLGAEMLGLNRVVHAPDAFRFSAT